MITDLRSEYFTFLKDASKQPFYSYTADVADAYYKKFQEKYSNLSSELFQQYYKRFKEHSKPLSKIESMCCENLIGYMCWNIEVTPDEIEKIVDQYKEMKGFSAYKQVRNSMSIAYDYGSYYSYTY